MKLGWQLKAKMLDEGFLRDLILRARQVIDNAGLGFGDGSSVDNIYGSWISYTTNAVANTEDTINHNLGKIPVGYLVMNRDKAAIVYKGGTAWTATQMFLKCSVATTAVVIFVIGPSNQG